MNVERANADFTNSFLMLLTGYNIIIILYLLFSVLVTHCVLCYPFRIKGNSKDYFAKRARYLIG